MKPASLIELYANSEKSTEVVNLLKENPSGNIHLNGIICSARSLFVNAISKKINTHQFIILPDKEEAAYFHNDLNNFNPKGKALFFPGSYKKAYQIEETDNSNVLLRAEVLEKINNREKNLLIVTYPEALYEKVVTRKNLESNTLKIKKGDEISLDFMNEVLIDYGFEKVDFVIEPGQFSIRGGITDIFSFSHEEPYRLEFFGDDVESIRTFDPVSQLSISDHESISIVANVQEKLLEESRESIFEFLPDNTPIWLENYKLTSDKIKKEFKKSVSEYKKIKSPVKHLSPEEMFISEKVFQEELQSFSCIEFGNKSYLDKSSEISFRIKPQPAFNKNFEMLSKNLLENQAKGFQNIIAAVNSKQIERLYAIFEDIEKEEVNFQPVLLSLHEGFIDEDLKVTCYTDHQIFNRYHKYKYKSGYNKKTEALTLKELHNLEKGDFVTHIDHGVGKFSGLEKIDVSGKKQEAIRIIYKNGDILYVSIHSLHKIAKYVGKEGKTPKVDKLGSNSWQKVKNKTKKRVKEIAFDLISLYAERKAKKGFEFSPDTYLQTELEASFLYEDTPDQLQATLDVKKDMESETPMDRLICGDVGFGKTEVAIRAAFKAVADNKQVAMLVPTTILTMQHFKTFRNRLREFPCNVDYINRFKSQSQQKKSLEKLKTGETDIMIGTHRLVGKDVKFKDLGLLIIDEEQKFGVSVKDKLKTLKVNLDTLTLTATPIPRTLQFSLMNARDLSVINTAPPNRQPIETHVHAFHEEVIRDSVMEEVSRGGQVFFVHNRVQNIKEVAGMIQRLCPDTKILTAHGQMQGDELEQKMVSFIDGEYDVLVATTIIESGLDIPNANTIIINQAHMFGLSDLHQMRGRVGRSNRKAFCYLLAPPLSSLTSEARKRLRAIEQFADLGSGFQIAMKDLDIRGAGNLLGGEQSGFIAEIGFDMYQKILNEAIQELKEKEFKDLYSDEEPDSFVKDCQIETDLEILLPDHYVSNISERLNLYKQIDSLEDEEELQSFENNLIDRFGPLPEATEKLLDTIRMRWLAKEIGFEKLVLKQNKLIGYFINDENSPYYQSEKFGHILKYVQKNPGNCKLKQKKSKLSLVFENVKGISQAISRLNPLKTNSKEKNKEVSEIN